jgi:hypothetical protein
MSSTHQAISRLQLVALQALWAQHARHSLDVAGDPRAARLAWASEQVKHPVASFSDLARSEAASLIDLLQKSLGQENKKKRGKRPRLRNREAAQAAGTEGRRGYGSKTTTMVSAEDLARIDHAITRLGWTRERFDAWLRSDSSPLGKTANPQIRTLADANKVWWPMKAMLKRDGKWIQNDESKFKGATA